MTYELAKQLKDAGYQISLMGKVCENCWGDLHGRCSSDCKEIELPTLSQLIKACGEMHFELERDWFNGKDKWRALIWSEGNVPTGFGSTAEEAVAKLWLALH